MRTYQRAWFTSLSIGYSSPLKRFSPEFEGRIESHFEIRFDIGYGT